MGRDRGHSEKPFRRISLAAPTSPTRWQFSPTRLQFASHGPVFAHQFAIVRPGGTECFGFSSVTLIGKKRVINSASSHETDEKAESAFLRLIDAGDSGVRILTLTVIMIFCRHVSISKRRFHSFCSWNGLLEIQETLLIQIVAPQ